MTPPALVLAQGRLVGDPTGHSHDPAGALVAGGLVVLALLALAATRRRPRR